MSDPMLPWLGGHIPYAYIPRSTRENHTTADGGRPAPIDSMMDTGIKDGKQSPQSKIFPANNVVNK